MGWDFYHDPRYDKQYIVNLKIKGEDLVYDGKQANVLAHSLRGNRLWRVIEKPDGVRFIALDLLKSGGRGEGWGNKGLCESMGPRELDCPLYFFELVPEPDGEYGAAWRDEVRAHHEQKKAKRRLAASLEAGMRLRYDGDEYTLVRPHVTRRGRKGGWIVKTTGGAVSWMTPALINKSEVIQ